MKNFYLFHVLLLSLSPSFAQWTKISSVPNNGVVSLVVDNDIIYAASDLNEIYKSSDGIVWSSIRVSNGALHISSIIFFDGKIYVGTFNFGVFVSIDNGNTWQSNGSGPSQISGLAVHNNVLYAATLGDGVAVLDSATGRWSSFNNSLPSYSVNVHSVASSPGSLLIAAGVNGTFYRYDFNVSEWNEEYYFGRLRPGLQINRLISVADTLWAVNGNHIINSNNGGVSWQDDKVGTHDGDSRFISAGKTNYYALTNLFPTGTWIQERGRNVATGSTWSSNEELLPTGFCYDILEFKNKLFLAKQDGLYTKDLIGAVLPTRLVSFNVKCENGKAVLIWKTAGETNNNHYDVEKSVDGTSYRVIGSLTAAGGSSKETSYSFVDNRTDPPSSYRIAEYDSDGRVQYTKLLQASCHGAGSFTLWPNPTQDIIRISMTSDVTSQAEIKLFDSKGTLVKLQRASLVQGNNLIHVNLESLARGIYQLSASWSKTHKQETVQVVKQ